MDLPDPVRSLLDAIVAGPLVWTPLATLMPPLHPSGTLEAAEGLGLLERWHRPDGLMVTLSPLGALAAGHLGTDGQWISKTILEPVEPWGDDEVYRWADSDHPPPPLRVSPQPRTQRLGYPETLVDATPGVFELVFGSDGRPQTTADGLPAYRVRFRRPPSKKRHKSPRAG